MTPVENDLRATLRNFGLKVGMIGTVKFEARIRELVANLPDLAVLVEPLLIVRRAIRERPFSHIQATFKQATRPWETARAERTLPILFSDDC
jgi:hypothetical protein